MLDLLLKSIQLKVTKKPVYLVICGVILVTLLFALQKNDFTNISIINVTVILVTGFLLFCLWKYEISPLKLKRNRSGFIIAIKTEDKHQDNLIQNDIVEPIRQILNNNSEVDFQVKKLQDWHVSEINSQETAIKYLKLCNAKLILFGSIKKRTEGENEFYILTLNQAVSHTEIPINISNLMAIELGNIFTSSIKINVNQEIPGFNVATLILADAAKYFVALASLINKKYDLAEKLFSEIKESSFLRLHKSKSYVNRIKKKILTNLRASRLAQNIVEVEVVSVDIVLPQQLL